MVCVAGDASGSDDPFRSWVPRQYRLPVKVFILNNEYMGMVRQWQELTHGRYSEAIPDGLPDFVKLRGGLWLDGIRIQGPWELEAGIAPDDRHAGSGAGRCRVAKPDQLLPDDPIRQRIRTCSSIRGQIQKALWRMEAKALVGRADR